MRWHRPASSLCAATRREIREPSDRRALQPRPRRYALRCGARRCHLRRGGHARIQPGSSASWPDCRRCAGAENPLYEREQHFEAQPSLASSAGTLAASVFIRLRDLSRLQADGTGQPSGRRAGLDRAGPRPGRRSAGCATRKGRPRHLGVYGAGVHHDAGRHSQTHQVAVQSTRRLSATTRRALKPCSTRTSYPSAPLDT